MMNPIRRRFLKWLLSVPVLGPMLFTETGCGGTRSAAGSRGIHLKNFALPMSDSEFRGNIYKNGRFGGPYTSAVDRVTVADILKWRMTPNPRADEKKNDDFALRVIRRAELPEVYGDYLMWLGHAAFLIRMGGRYLLTDPCMTHPPFVPRLAPAPMDIGKVSWDYVLISHGHYDHLDADSIGMIRKNGACALAPLKLGGLIRSMNPKLRIQEAGWFQRFDTGSGPAVHLVPAHHWHRRTAFDMNRCLWGSFLIQFRGKSLFFAGDTAYNSHFREIRRVFGPVDYALMPIAAYEPAYIMKDNHMTPEEAVRAFHDLEAKVFIPMHFGTFDLSDEPLGDPIRRLEGLVKAGAVHGEVRRMDAGEVMRI